MTAPAIGKVVVGSGWWSSDAPSPWLVGDPALKRPQFFGLWLHLVRRYINPAQIVVVDSASPLKPPEMLRRSVLWTSLDRNYGHANDIRIGAIATKHSGFTKSVLLSAMYALCMDADLFCYVEQDCVMRGEAIIDRALAGRAAGIMIGRPTECGRGPDGGRAASMPQNSLIIVGRASLERFINGLLKGPESDGQLSPEIKLSRDCAPVEWLAIPYGRSRPIDFAAPCYYAQHLTADELRRFLASEGLDPAEFGLEIGVP